MAIFLGPFLELDLFLVSETRMGLVASFGVAAHQVTLCESATLSFIRISLFMSVLFMQECGTCGSVFFCVVDFVCLFVLKPRLRI